MKVLLLPVNLASDISHKVRALSQAGIDAQGVAISPNIFQTSDNIKVFPLSGKADLNSRMRKFAACLQIWKMIAWADLLHWIGEPVMFEQSVNHAFLRWIDKPGVVQFMGSDVRIPEADFEVNPYYRNVFNSGYEYTSESRTQSMRTQRFFAELGFVPLEFIGLERYIDKDLFPERFRTWQPIDTAEYVPHFPDADTVRPLVVHAPTAPKAKGTEHVVAAVEALKDRHEFDFRLVENTDRNVAQQLIHDCDIFIDQLILGSHGYAAVEALAFGKPVIAYINADVGKNYPQELPIVNANPDSIAEVLSELLADGPRRHQTGVEGRKYVENYHDENKIAHDLIDIYKETIMRHRTKTR